jgi:uncharacterized protein (TIGR02996 family)
MPSLEAVRATEVAFLEDVCRHPGDDVPRLIYADWLDEHGEGGDSLRSRAEFIRVQCELARTVQAPDGSADSFAAARWLRRRKALRRRERELLGRTTTMSTRQVFEPEYGWLPEPVRYLFETGPRDGRHDRFWEWRRGFVEEITLTAEVFAGGPCTECANGTVPNDGGDNTCPDCHGTGRTEGHATALFRAAPVRRVTLFDREPSQYPGQSGRGRWYWPIAPPVSADPRRVPLALWNLLETHERCDDGAPLWCSRTAALDALAAACLLYGRRAAWPCPECGGKGAWDRSLAQIGIPRPCPACAGRGHTVEEG